MRILYPHLGLGLQKIYEFHMLLDPHISASERGKNQSPWEENAIKQSLHMVSFINFSKKIKIDMCLLTSFLFSVFRPK